MWDKLIFSFDTGKNFRSKVELKLKMNKEKIEVN